MQVLTRICLCLLLAPLLSGDGLRRVSEDPFRTPAPVTPSGEWLDLGNTSERAQDPWNRDLFQDSPLQLLITIMADGQVISNPVLSSSVQSAVESKGFRVITSRDDASAADSRLTVEIRIATLKSTRHDYVRAIARSQFYLEDLNGHRRRYVLKGPGQEWVSASRDAVISEVLRYLEPSLIRVIQGKVPGPQFEGEQYR